MARLKVSDILDNADETFENKDNNSKSGSGLALDLENIVESQSKQVIYEDVFDEQLMSSLRGALGAGVATKAVLEARQEARFENNNSE